MTQQFDPEACGACGHPADGHVPGAGCYDEHGSGLEYCPCAGEFHPPAWPTGMKAVEFALGVISTQYPALSVAEKRELSASFELGAWAIDDALDPGRLGPDALTPPSEPATLARIRTWWSCEQARRAAAGSRRTKTTGTAPVGEETP
jgi:hypothetical protein